MSCFADLINHAPQSIEPTSSPLATGVHLNIYMQFDDLPPCAASSLPCSPSWQQEEILETNFRLRLGKQERQRTMCSRCKINTHTLQKVFQNEFNIHKELRKTATQMSLKRLIGSGRTYCCSQTLLGLLFPFKQDKMSQISNLLIQVFILIWFTATEKLPWAINISQLYSTDTEM